MDDWQIMQSLARLVGWIFIPPFATFVLQALWYKLKSNYQHNNYNNNNNDSRSTQTIPPLKGSPRYTLAYNRILCGVIVLYLVYHLLDVCRSFGPTHYDVLGLQFHDFTHQQLKRNSRRASMQYHPNKAGPEGTDAFVNLRAGHDILVNPVLRHAYDRFGSSVLRCTHCITTKDYLDNGLSTVAVLYAITFIVLILMSVFRWVSFGRYWRFILLAAMSGLELTIVLSPKPLQVMMAWLMPYWVTFEKITLLNHVYLAVSIALYKVGPILTPWHADNNNNNNNNNNSSSSSSSSDSAYSEKTKKETIRKQLKRLEELMNTSSKQPTK
ncbi:MAG: hypothetical protein J3Q66DRAFT_413610 [Benniella sp.]|nr:MAG: hypothetical protein J3Q66DRAFT_413610 [Benniella sp.]